MKRIICFLLATCVFAISGCSSTPAPGNTDKSKPITTVLTDKGMELIGKVDKLAECEEYIDLYTVDDEISKVIKGIAANDYTTPQGVFVIENLGAVVFKTMIPETKLPEDIAKMVEDRFTTTLPSQVAAMSGTPVLAATSILNHTESFIYESLQSSVTYLYVYGNGSNFMVNYHPNGENIVNASVNIVVNDELSKCTAKEDVVNFFKDTLGFWDLSVSTVTEEK